MAEWHLPPDYIVVNWTDELLNLMVEKLVERKKKEVKAIRPISAIEDSGERRVSDKILFARAGNLIKAVKK